MTLTVNPDPTPEQVRLTVVPGGQLVHAPPLTEDFVLVADAKELAPSALLLVALNRTALAGLTPFDLATPICLLKPLLGAGVRGLGLGMA